MTGALDSPTITTANASRRGRDSYDGIEPRLAELAALDPGDPRWVRLREEIVVCCLPLAEHIARKYSGRGEQYDDLLQVARCGLLEAVKRFDPAYGATFVSFAVPTIMGEVRRHFRDRTWAVRVPRRLKELRVHLHAAGPVLMQQLGRTPAVTELADHLGLDREEVVQVMIASNGYDSDTLDPSPDNDEGHVPSPLRRLAAVDPCYALIEDAMTVRPLLAGLSDRDRNILTWRYFGGESQARIAARLGVSQMQISRHLTRILTTLRDRAADDQSLLETA
ncbi:SigB/SigF/SigG family RNA polymerase sigma factor [Nocardia sp. alder85J]|uniref:SigB/SigF/SigG family RNA polymerase sigma factor n=1 Tax=Nocardia sp. alder85J TaxID=2862949 RepID=UPI001CD2FA6F|nr:SigB/SigF/SigG family RNA polymerase sigma factor [Nocardia sp. alder85J]MCX4098578.1 SigB/SigF/SigG family RNA polymerase sigma factor [Nocardia sp. alder85J]